MGFVLTEVNRLPTMLAIKNSFEVWYFAFMLTRFIFLPVFSNFYDKPDAEDKCHFCTN
jgi:hypothetical protein